MADGISTLICTIQFSVIFATVASQVTFSLDKSSCYKTGNTAVLTAVYTGANTLRYVNWYYERASGTNIIDVTDCSTFLTDSVFPNTRMTYSCETGTKTYKATITDLTGAELDEDWGASFTDTSGTTTSTASLKLSTACSGGFPWWGIFLIVLGCVVVVGGGIGTAYCKVTEKACFAAK